MKLTVRDFLWLTLLVAGVSAWRLERGKALSEINALRAKSWLLKPERNVSLEAHHAERRTLVATLRQQTDEQLEADFAARQSEQGRSWLETNDPYLVEMTRRRMTAALQRQYDLLMSCQEDPSKLRYDPNLELLTALRRSQGRPDPLTIHLQITNVAYGRTVTGPCVKATVENVDELREPVCFTDGGDDRGGRRERWRFVMTDPQGRQIRDSNYCALMGGGLCGFGPLAYGETGRRFNFFDLRKYVAPPPSGIYWLQAHYHNEIPIADEPDLSPLIVTKSEPLLVRVDNREPPQHRTANKLVFPWAVLGGCVLLTLAAAFSAKPCRNKPTDQPSHNPMLPRRRDMAWNILLMMITVAMLVDMQSLCRRKAHLGQRPDQSANWSIQRIE